MADQYKRTVEKNCIKKLRDIKEYLPPCAWGYFDFLQTAPRTKVAYAYDLKVFFEYLEETSPLLSSVKDIEAAYLQNLTMQDITDYLNHLRYDADNEERAVARKLSSVRGFWKWLVGMGMVTNNPTLLVKSKKIPKKAIVMMEPEETRHVLDAIGTGEVYDIVREKDGESYAGMGPAERKDYKPTIAPNSQKRRDELKISTRDDAIISVLLGTGLRVSELVGLDTDDLDFNNNSLRVIRKGGDESRVYFSDPVAEKLKAYLPDRKIPKDGSSALFVSAHYKRYSVRSVELLVQKYVDPLIDNKHITTHKLRATYATDLYRASHDILLTSTALNHSSPAVTAAHYADIGDERRKEAAYYIDYFEKKED